MRTFFLVLAVALVIIGLIAGGTYLSEPLWLHALKDKSGNLDPGALLKLVVVVPAAVVGLLSSILAGLASYLVAKANHASALTLADKQFEYTTKLEKMRRDAADELEKQKGKIIRDLDEKRNVLAGSLEAEKVRLSIRRAEMDEKLSLFAEAREVSTLYRLSIGALRTNSFEAEEADECRRSMIRVRNKLRGTLVHKDWCDLEELGYFIQKKAVGIKVAGQRKLWTGKSRELDDEPLGLAFAKIGERVLQLLDKEALSVRAMSLSAESRPATEDDGRGKLA